MTDIAQGGTFSLGDKTVFRMGYGAMQLSGPGIMGEPKDRPQAIAVLRAAIEAGVNHIDTSDFYGPYTTNRLIKEALHPYADNLTLVTKIGARRDASGNWLPAFSRQEIIDAVHSNLTNLGLEQLDVVNLRAMFSAHGPAEGSIAEPYSVLAEMQQQGLIHHLGISNATLAQVQEAQAIAPIVCVQNQYNIALRDDDSLVDWLAQHNIAFVPFFPLGGFTPLQVQAVDTIAGELNASSMQVALAWLLQRSPNILLIPGTSSLVHLQDNLGATQIRLSADQLARLNTIG
ncbi:oxidoreductase [Vibrio porteresiae]|uniref:Oxidoreductase n=1 Tax=Vibrio porteresiae DSM 19223 TaxID=1123496 RepID=A0ABZ0QHC2_9VIBR|nr:oxidoreductase [Vibrio porteresiae]WPC75602.1 oxidoreductase [Vibrio porteresiae DSM 19223]